MNLTALFNRVLLGMLLALPFAAAAQEDPPPELAHIEALVERGMADWGIPGLAVSVVKDDELAWARGFGVRRLGHPEPVDADTLFNVASVSKAFNAAALGLLVDEGRIGWDDPVADHLPGLRLYDPWVTRSATVRDMLSHRVGLGRLTGNRLRWISARGRDEQIARLRHLPPERDFRAGYVYSNVLYMVAGEVVPAVTGTEWADFVERRLFAPLGMQRSLAAGSRLDESGNVAWPHQEIDGEVVESRAATSTPSAPPPRCIPARARSRRGCGCTWARPASSKAARCWHGRRWRRCTGRRTRSRGRRSSRSPHTASAGAWAAIADTRSPGIPAPLTA